MNLSLGLATSLALGGSKWYDFDLLMVSNGAFYLLVINAMWIVISEHHD
jgi:hypothetical protein